MRLQLYGLLAVTLGFVVVGTALVLIDRNATAISLPFMAAGLIGLYASSVLAQLAQRVERLERAHAEQVQVNSAAKPPAGQGST